MVDALNLIISVFILAWVISPPSWKTRRRRKP